MMSAPLFLRASLCALFILALALLPALRTAEAQSGRHKPQTPATARPTTTSTRPRTVNQTGSPREQSSPATRSTSSSSTTAERVPSNPTALGEPPAFPTPAPAPEKAAPNKEEEIDAADVLHISSNLVTVPASVIDAQGRAVTNLKLEDFELRVDGQPQPISELGFADSPVRMAVLFDNSSSLTSAREFEKQAATRFFRSVLRPSDQAMIYSVSTIPTMEQPLTSDVQALVRTIEHFPKPEGATALFDAIAQAAAYLKPHQEGRRVIVIVSDGADTISDLDFETTLKRAQAADCQIYAVQTGQIENANLHDLAAERRLQEFTAQTGGAVYVPHGNNDLDAAFAQIAADLSQQYVLSYYPEDEQKDGRFRTLNVRVTTRPNLRVRARKGYYALPGQKQAWLPNVTSTPDAQTQSNALTNNATLRLDQPGTSPGAERNAGAGGVRPDGNSNATALASSPVYLKANNAATVRDRVGPRGPTDDTGGTTAASREPRGAEPDAVPDASSNAPPASSSSSASAPSSSSASPTTASSSSSSNSSSEPAPPSSSSSSSPSPTPSPSPSAAAAQSNAAQTAQRAAAPVSGGVLNGKAISLPKPVYPLAARNMGAAGTVVVEVMLDESGKVISAHALSGPTLLLSSCVNAARQARFSPTILSGQPVKVLGTITYTFKP